VVVQYIAFPHKEKGEKGNALSNLKRSYEILKSKPQDMESLAEDLNLTVKETMPFSREEIVPEVGNLKDVTLISFKIRPRLDIIPVIDENELGASYIIRVKEKIPSRIKPKNEVSEYMKAVLADRKALLLAEKKADEIYQSGEKDKLNIKAIAKKYGLTLRETPLLTRFEYIEGIGEAYQVVDEAFKLKPGAISEPIESRRGFIIIEPFEFQGVDEKKFREDKESYKNKYIAFKKMKAFEAWSENMKANSSLNVDLDSI